MKAFLVCALLGAAALLSGPPPGICTLPDAERSSTRSDACLSCHDGSVASDRHSTHVHVSYLEYMRTGRYALRPYGPVRPVLLVEGRVECTSCHDGHAGQPHALAATLAGSALCRSCHER